MYFSNTLKQILSMQFCKTQTEYISSYAFIFNGNQNFFRIFEQINKKSEQLCYYIFTNKNRKSVNSKRLVTALFMYSN